MVSRKLAGVVGASALLAVPAVSLAAKAVTPKDGKFTGTPHYKVKGKRESASLTITVAHDKITGVQMVAQVLPQDPKHSHGYACGAANVITSQGYHSSGTVARDGAFSYTWTMKGQGGFRDKITLAGKFKSPTAATGTIRDAYVIPSAKSACDTGTLPFTVRHQ